MNERVTIEITGGVADVRLARPDKLNALDDAMFEAIIAAGEQVLADRSVRAVVLSGEGRAFCAGLDTEKFGRMAAEDGAPGAVGSIGAALIARTHGACNRAQYAALVWREVPAPVICAVHGAALGGGFQLILGADIRIIAPDAKLSILEIKWGLVPDMGGVPLLRGLVREDIVRELTYTGRVFTGEEAGRIGVATRVCADPRAEALALAKDIAGKSPGAIRAAKRLLNGAAGANLAADLMAESVEQAALMGSPNQTEAVRANRDGRPPTFID